MGIGNNNSNVKEGASNNFSKEKNTWTCIHEIPSRNLSNANKAANPDNKDKASNNNAVNSAHNNLATRSVSRCASIVARDSKVGIGNNNSSAKEGASNNYKVNRVEAL
ncbi:hypothetical protein EFJ49_24325 [Escherichia coli]|nr:hypothetical protein [Escherichia coli]